MFKFFKEFLDDNEEYLIAFFITFCIFVLIIFGCIIKFYS